MHRYQRSWIPSVVMIAFLALLCGPEPARSQPKKKFATKADIERLEKKLEEQRVLVSNLIALNQQYLRQLVALAGDQGTEPTAVAMKDPPQTDTKPVMKPAVVTMKKPDKPEPAKPAFGTIVGKVKG